MGVGAGEEGSSRVEFGLHLLCGLALPATSATSSQMATGRQAAAAAGSAGGRRGSVAGVWKGFPLPESGRAYSLFTASIPFERKCLCH